MKPIVIEHEGISVVRDDLYAGGTKARFLPILFDGVDEVVYASPAEGGAQTALATVAAQLGKRATIFVAHRAEPHPRALMAKRLGARVMQVRPGYLSVVQARAKEYAEACGARLMPFGADLPEAVAIIATAARATGIEPDAVWCAAGSGVLARSLSTAWPNAQMRVVQVGRTLGDDDVGAAAAVYVYPKPFSKAADSVPPFPSDPHYDAKAWEIAATFPRREQRVLFWNVTGPAA